MMTRKTLYAFFGDGWNRHDVDCLMTFMADDCVFESTAGPEACGTRHAGREPVRGQHSLGCSRCSRTPRSRCAPLRGRRARRSEWLFTGTTADGGRSRSTAATSSRSRGQDRVKSSYFKTRTA